MVERLLGLLLIISRNPQYVAKVALFAVGALIVTLIVTSKVHQGRKIAALKAQASLPITAVVVKAGTRMKTGLEFRVTDSKQIEAFKIALQTVKNPYWNRPGSSIELIIKGPDGSEFTVPGGGGYVQLSIESADPMAIKCSLDSEHPGDLRCTFIFAQGIIRMGQFRTKGLHAWIRNLGP
ncbi:MAG: hypothetical protein OSB73_20215 [Candidatus Latescibacteria bacterium]|nr:hypothetical protein [Candidatus Latescibacterota bacterium]